MVDLSGDYIDLTTNWEFRREASPPDMGARRSKRIAKADDEDTETQAPLYDEPPHELVEGDESTYPPQGAYLSSMWVYQVVRCPFISQNERYQRWPAVFPSKEPLRSTWENKGLPAKLWSIVRERWVYPVVFGKYQLHGDEGNAEYDIDQSEFVGAEETNATHDVQDGTDCIVQKPPVTLKAAASGSGSSAQPKRKADDAEEEPAPKKLQVGRRAKIPVTPKSASKKPQAGRPAKIPVTPKSSNRRSTSKQSSVSTTHQEPAASATKGKGEASGPAVATSKGKGKATSKGKGKVTAKVKGKAPESASSATKEEKIGIKSEPQSSPANVIDSNWGGKRFVIDDSDTDEQQGNAAELTALKEEKARHEDQLQQAQGKVVLLAAALHSTWNVLQTYGERMADWTGVIRSWTKERKTEHLDNLLGNLTDNSEVNKTLRRKINAIYDEVAAMFPALDRITLDDEAFNAWREMTPQHLEKLIEKDDQRVNGMGKVHYAHDDTE